MALVEYPDHALATSYFNFRLTFWLHFKQEAQILDAQLLALSKIIFKTEMT